MGIDSKLINIKNNKSIYCDRLYNLKNELVEVKGLQNYLLNQGLPKYILVDLIHSLNALFLFKEGIYASILEELGSFDDYDIFVLIDESDERFYEF